MPDWINITLRSLGALVTYIEYIVGITVGSIAAFMATEMDGPIYHSIIRFLRAFPRSVNGYP